MKHNILYDEGYEYDLKDSTNLTHLHFDYGTRYNQINMQFQHFHTYYEIYILLTGESQHVIEGKVYDLQTYDFVLLKPFELHRTNYLEGLPCKRMILSFELDWIKEVFPVASEAYQNLFDVQCPIYRFSEEIRIEFIELFNKMYKSAKEAGTTSDIIIVSYFIQILEKIRSQSMSNRYFDEAEAGYSLENRIYEMTSYIHENFKEKLTLGFLSDKFYISPHYLSRQFKRVTHFTLIKYIQQIRIKRAQELLLDTDLKITEIVDICGFGSLSQFNRVFNTIVKNSPTMYRNLNKIN